MAAELPDLQLILGGLFSSLVCEIVSTQAAGLTAAGGLLAQVLHIDAMAGILPDLQMLALRRAQQVRQGLVVDLQEAAFALDRALACALQRTQHLLHTENMSCHHLSYMLIT